MNENAAALGRLAKGVPKNFSKAERQRRRKQMTELNRQKAKKNNRHSFGLGNGEIGKRMLRKQRAEERKKAKSHESNPSNRN